MDFNPADVLSFFMRFNKKKHEQAEAIVRAQAAWAAGAGLIPVPLLDVAAVVSVQLSMVEKLAKLYETPYDGQNGRAIVTALLGTGAAGLGSSLLKGIPVVGSILGGLSMSLTSAAITYATGQVFVRHFAAGGSLEDFDLEVGRKIFEEELERGRRFAEDLARKGRPTSVEEDNVYYERTYAGDDVFAKLKELSKLHADGVITTEEFNKKKQELLDSME